MVVIPRKPALLFALGALLLLAVLFALGRTKRPPLLPADQKHEGLTQDAACARCHGPAGPSPLRAGHPPKEKCLYCHRAARP